MTLAPPVGLLERNADALISLTVAEILPSWRVVVPRLPPDQPQEEQWCNHCISSGTPAKRSDMSKVWLSNVLSF